jgi:hypothetical protein
MANDLKTAILKMLAGSSSQRPVDVSRLYKLGDEAGVQAALLEMYHASQVCCCLIIRRGVETSVWWRPGVVNMQHSYGRTTRSGA